MPAKRPPHPDPKVEVLRERARKRIRNWHRKNAKRLNEQSLQWYRNNSVKANKAARERYKINPAKSKRRAQEWRSGNKERMKASQRLYHIKRYYSDLNYKIAKTLRARLRIALHRRSKAGSAVRDLGTSIPDFKVYIESMFQPGMSWENWGKGIGKWNLDHIKPLASFDLTDRIQFLEACHYTNLQPLWAEENLRKRAR